MFAFEEERFVTSWIPTEERKRSQMMTLHSITFTFYYIGDTIHSMKYSLHCTPPHFSLLPSTDIPCHA